MNRIKTTAIIVLVITALIVAISGAVIFRYKVWRMKHPEAPIWTYIIKGD
jgi:hypothetical protein